MSWFNFCPFCHYEKDYIHETHERTCVWRKVLRAAKWSSNGVVVAFSKHEKEPLKVWLDDIREAPKGWTRTYTVDETIEQLKTKQVQKLSLDNDLGIERLQGFKVLDWLEEQVYIDQFFPIPTIFVHSSNAARQEHMSRAIESIHRIRAHQIKEAEKNHGH